MASLDYDGCCSHTALAEQIPGETDSLTDEQIEAKEAERRQRCREQRAAKHKATRLDFEAWQATLRQMKPIKKRSRAKAKSTRRFACDPCDVAFEDQSALNLHNTSKKHLDNVNGVHKVVKHPADKTRLAANVAAKRYYCKICDHAYLN